MVLIKQADITHPIQNKLKNMTKRDFFVLIIKLFGLYMLVNSLFSWVTFNLSVVMRDLDLISIIWMFVALVVMLGFFVLLIFKSANVLNLLKLDKNFDDERIDFGNFNPTSIVKLALIITGGLMILDNIPNLLSQILLAFKRDSMGTTFQPNSYVNIVTSGIKILVGFLIVTNYSGITKLLKLNEKTK